MRKEKWRGDGGREGERKEEREKERSRNNCNG